MKITKIVAQGCLVYSVTLTPNPIEAFFGVKEKTVNYRDTGQTFTYGGGHAYVSEDGDFLSNDSAIGKAIDKYRNRF